MQDTTAVRAYPKGARGQRAADSAYTSRLQKGGALLEDMRLLVRNWEKIADEQTPGPAMYGMLLGKLTRTRAVDTVRRAFLPRFVNGRPAKAWKMVRELEDHNLPVEILRPVYYWLTARNEPLLYDFVTAELLSRSKMHPSSIAAREVALWITAGLSAHGKAWSPTVTTKVARGVLAALRDFGILEGAVKKKIAPVYMPIESFAFVAFALHQDGASGSTLLTHPDWSLFLFSPAVVERMALEADRNRLLRYQAAGRIARIDFPANTFREMADVIAARTVGRST